MINIRRIAKGLGWFSIALGLAEVFDCQGLERFLGIENREGTLRFFGVREIAVGIGILSSPGPHSGWLWARVAGDALDLGALGTALDFTRAFAGGASITGRHQPGAFGRLHGDGEPAPPGRTTARRTSLPALSKFLPYTVVLEPGPPHLS